MFDVEDENLAVMTVTLLSNHDGLLTFSREIPILDVFQQIYIPQDDLVAHSRMRGNSPDGKKHYHYHFSYGNKSISSEVINSFISEGWSQL